MIFSSGEPKVRKTDSTDMRLLKTWSIVCAALLLLFTANAVFADADEGFSIGGISGDYIITIASPVAAVAPGTPVFLNARLLDAKTQNPVRISSADVNITQNDLPVFSSELTKNPRKALGFTYSFPSAKNYLIHISFYRNGTLLASGNYPLAVKNISDTAPFIPEILLGMFLLAVLFFIFRTSS